MGDPLRSQPCATNSGHSTEVLFEWDQIHVGRKIEFLRWLMEHRHGVRQVCNGHNCKIYELDAILDKEILLRHSVIEDNIKFLVYFSDDTVATKAQLIWK